MGCPNCVRGCRARVLSRERSVPCPLWADYVEKLFSCDAGERIYADGGYQGPKAAKAAARTGRWKIEVIKRSATAVGFEVLPKRWIVERTFAWISRYRRMVRDFERYARTVAPSSVSPSSASCFAA